MTGFDLSIDAERDLREIWRYTAQTWDMRQADQYLDGLEKCCRELTEAFVKSWPEIHGQLRSRRCQRHVIFFLSFEDKRPLVIAFLHERMDLLTRLKKRI